MAVSQMASLSHIVGLLVQVSYTMFYFTAGFNLCCSFLRSSSASWSTYALFGDWSVSLLIHLSISSFFLSNFFVWKNVNLVLE